MKKLFLLLLLCPSFTYAQEAVIHFDIKNNAEKKIYASRGDYASPEIFFGSWFTHVPLTDGKGTYTVKLSQPLTVNVYYSADSTQQPSEYFFFLLPGDDITFSADAQSPQTRTVTGKGSENNQPGIQEVARANQDLMSFKKDSVPDNVFRAIKAQNIKNQQALKKYIGEHKPSAEFIRMYTLYVQYYPAWKFIRFKGDQKFSIRKPYFRNEAPWEAIEDSLKQATPLSNTEALQIPMHAFFLSNYLMRLKERVWMKPELYDQYVSASEKASLIKDDPENRLLELIIEKNFTGKTAEYLYAVLFKGSINEKEDNLPEIFARYKRKYPKSPYLPYIEPDIRKIEERRQRKLNDNMVLVKNSHDYQTFEDVLKLVKGKTVLLDMWGTWCGPCRSEMLTNSDSIKNHFKDKNLDFLYIANLDQGKEAKWKELIAYYNLSGTHILADETLTKDIMKKVKGTGYPTYVIIKKDGTFELSQAGYPMKREVLVEQLEKALKE